MCPREEVGSASSYAAIFPSPRRGVFKEYIYSLLPDIFPYFGEESDNPIPLRVKATVVVYIHYYPE